MYREMSPETAAFIDMMFDSEAFDVLSREGKWTGGYMTAFPLYKQPFSKPFRSLPDSRIPLR